MEQYLVFISLILLQAVICFGFKHNNFTRKIFFLLMLIELGLIMGMRSVNVGEDTISYYNIYLLTAGAGSISSLSFLDMEYGYLLLNRVLSYFSHSPQLLFMATGFFIAFSTLRFIEKNVRIFWLGVIIYLTLGKFFYDMNALRQALAVAILLFSYPFILKRKFIPFILITVAASFMHTSALFFTIIYFLYPLKLRLMNVFSYVCLSIIGLLLLLLAVRYSPYAGYMQSIWWGLNFKLSSFMLLMLSLCIFCFNFFCYWVKRKSAREWENSLEGKEMKFLLFTNMFLIEVTLLGFAGPIFSRLFIYMSVFYMVSIPKSVSLLPRANARALCITAILLMCIFYQGVIIKYRPDWTAVIPYETYLSNPSNIRTKITMSSTEFL